MPDAIPAERTRKMEQITIEKTGRRYYLQGNTYPIKDQLRAAGAHWDREERAWWTSREDVAQAAVQAAEKEIKEAATAARYVKLADGSWGAVVPSAVGLGPGSTIKVRKASGEIKEETVGEVLSSSEGGESRVTLARRQRRASGGGRRFSRGRRGGECNCGACEDLLSIGYRPGQRIICDECGGWAEAC